MKKKTVSVPLAEAVEAVENFKNAIEKVLKIVRVTTQERSSPAFNKLSEALLEIAALLEK